MDEKGAGFRVGALLWFPDEFTLRFHKLMQDERL